MWRVCVNEPQTPQRFLHASMSSINERSSIYYKYAHVIARNIEGDVRDNIRSPRGVAHKQYFSSLSSNTSENNTQDGASASKEKSYIRINKINTYCYMTLSI